MEPQTKRAKIRLQFPEKVFYEKLLAEWKENIADKNHAYVIKKALTNLKLFPLNVHGYTELRKIRGIGEDIATRLDAAWKHACDTHFATDTPTIKQIKELSRGEAFKFLERTAATLNSGTRKRNIIPFVPKDKLTTNTKNNEVSKTTTNTNIATMSSSQFTSYSPINCQQFQMEAKFHKNNVGNFTSSNVNSVQSTAGISSLLEYVPGETTGKGRVVLITDNREGIAGVKGKRKGKGVCEHLDSLGVLCDNRTLSVGDYLWVLQWTDMQNKQHEMVLDYVIERKTWDDLKKSIREARYLEQKSRLSKSGIRNVIMIIEGGINSDRSLEQAMVSTGVDNNFFVHRTTNMQGTAKFLQHLTKRLEERYKTEAISGPSFEEFQETCKKPKPITVSDCWLRQLTVCPGMSIDRAQLIRQRFPSFPALTQFYKSNRTGNTEEDQKLLSMRIPLLPTSISKQLHTFFNQALE